MARCRDQEVVRGQIAAHYPQARIHEIPEEEDPLRLGEGEEAWSMTLSLRRPRVRAPESLSRRRPAGPRL